MRGYPLARATSRDGRWAYTLYGGGAYAFVHALDTSRAQAVCVGLPWRGNADLSRLRLSVSAAGDRLLVTKQRARGTAATIDLKAFRVVGASRL